MASDPLAARAVALWSGCSAALLEMPASSLEHSDPVLSPAASPGCLSESQEGLGLPHLSA